jgi:hypothetical protein
VKKVNFLYTLRENENNDFVCYAFILLRSIFAENKIYIFGGYGGSKLYYNDMYLLVGMFHTTFYIKYQRVINQFVESYCLNLHLSFW